MRRGLFYMSRFSAIAQIEEHSDTPDAIQVSQNYRCLRGVPERWCNRHKLNSETICRARNADWAFALARLGFENIESSAPELAVLPAHLEWCRVDRGRVRVRQSVRFGDHGVYI